MKSIGSRVVAIAALCYLAVLATCGGESTAVSGQVKDEALQVGRLAASLTAAGDDTGYFKDMDSGAVLTPEEAQGRITWNIWTAGNDRMWDTIGTSSFGALDFVKTVSSYKGPGPNPSLKFGRHNRWQYLGLVNEPCFEEATGPDPNRFGLWLDKRKADCPPDPFEDEQKYPGVAIGARGKNLPVGSLYGYASGIVGLRLFPNPAFDAAAAAKWDPVRFYNDPTYYKTKDLIRPYRVGMSCGFCHVGPNPLNPPADPEAPAWANLSSNVGAQYFWIDRIFSWEADSSNFVYQVFHTSRPGALDTSLISTDNINNPRTMNAVYGLGDRLMIGKKYGREKLAGGSNNNKQFGDYPQTAPFASLFEKPDTVYTPKVLKDGADSVGALGALNRVFLNIGLFSEEWLTHFRPLVGGKPITPIEIAVNRKNSSYWNATEAQSPNTALFFLKTTAAHHLKDAPGGSGYLTEAASVLTQGKTAFADRCARCHSSKFPTPPPDADPGGPTCAGAGYLKCWDSYWKWTETEDFRKKMRPIVAAKDFLDGNYLSTDLRVPVTLLETNACSPLATNGLKDNIWDNFSSQSYKELPPVGTVKVVHPVTGVESDYVLPGGGRGYTRPPSLISVWSTAPLLLNNSLGRFEWSPAVDARMRSFQDSIEQLLWPEKREKDSKLGSKGVGLIDRTTQQSYLRIATAYLPERLQNMLGFWSRLFPKVFVEDNIEIGPFPKGMPVNLITNVNLLPETTPNLRGQLRTGAEVADLVLKVKLALARLPKNATDQQAEDALGGLVDELLGFSKCPDFVVNRGHYFGTDRLKDEPALSDADKRALIAFLKTF